MKIVDYDVFNATNYYTVFECSKLEKLDLLTYLYWLEETDASNKIVSDEKYSPSGEWIKWLSGNFLAFSENQIMVKSGHKLYRSYNPQFIPAYSRLSFKVLIKHLFNTVKRFTLMDKLSYQASKSQFKKCYPNYEVGEEFYDIAESHPGAYFRALESNAILGDVRRDVAFEIGSGAGVNPIVNFLRFGSKSIILDLPETIQVAYILIKAFAPSSRVALPDKVDKEMLEGGSFENLVDKYDFVFILPTQAHLLDSGFVDVAYNTASFQEMDIEVVRNYVKLIHKVLKPGGAVSILNLEVSRQIKGNAVDQYGLALFKEGTLVDARFSNFQINGLENLKYICFVGKK